MSYYGNYSSASILDPYCVGGSRYGGSSGLGDTLLDRKENFYTTSYGSSYSHPTSSDYLSSSGTSRGSRPSAYDRYVSYLADELTSTGSALSSRSTRNNYGTTSHHHGHLHSSDSNDDFKLPPLSSTRRLLTDGYSSNLRSLGYSSGSSNSSGTSSTGRPLITSVPAYDKYGKELSNYERWKLQQGETTGYTSSAATGSSDSRKIRSRLLSDDSAVSSSAVTTDRAERETTTVPSAVAAAAASLVRDISPAFTSRFLSSTSGGKSIVDSSSSYSRPTSYRSTHSFPANVRSKLSSFDVQDVRGDGGCYYRCLSLYFTGSEDSYNKYRREVMSYIRENLDSYSSMIKSEVGYASTNDYFSRKLRTDHQEFAETTEIIATCCLYDINIHVLALVPGRHSNWEWLHFDPSIGSGKPSYTSRNIYLYNQGSVHFMLCTPK